MAKETSTALVTTGPAGITLADGQWPLVQRSKEEIDAIKDAVKESLGGDAYAMRGLVQQIGLSLAADKGAPRYLVPNGTDEPDRKAEITGIIIGVRSTRAKYIKAFADSGGGTPPDCASSDNVTGFIRANDDGSPVLAHARGALSRPCEGCPFNKPGDCRQTDYLFLVVPGEFLFPLVIHATPGSLNALTKYKVGLINQFSRTGSIPKIGDVLTKFGLVTATSKAANVPYNQMTFACEGKLDLAAKAQVEAYAKAMSGLMDAYARLDQKAADAGGNVTAHRPTDAPVIDVPGSADLPTNTTQGDDDDIFR